MASGPLAVRLQYKDVGETSGLLIYPLFAGISLAAGEGFEPSLTDPELLLVRSDLY